MKQSIIVTLLLLLSNFSYADIDECQQDDNSQKDFVCGQCEKGDVEWLFGDDMGPESDDPANEENRKDFKNGLLADLMDPSKTVKGPGASSLNPFSGTKVKDLKSVEDFVEFLPEKFKKNVVFMSPSRSLQEGDRYLMKSPNSEIVMSFNSHHNEGGDMSELRGGNAVEMQVWNGAKGIWEYVEIDFSEGKPKVSRNPGKCLNCHGRGTNTRPNFDAYNFWSQTKPFFRDRIVAGTKEAEDYLNFLKKIEKDAKEFKETGKKTRFSILAPMLEVNKVKDVERALSQGQNYQLKVDTSDGFSTNADGGAAVNLFDQMYLTNHCRIANLTTNPKHNPFADQMKYALAAAVRGTCITSDEDLSKFLPPELLKNSQLFFKNKGYKSGNFKDVKEETSNAQKDYYEDRIGRKLWNIEEEKLKEIKNTPEYKNKLAALEGDEEALYQHEVKAEKEAYRLAKLEMKKLSDNSDRARDKERSLDRFAPMRYLLEPMGIDTSMFSISVDPLSYTFGDFFFNIERFGAFKELKGKSCNELKQLSMDALNKEGIVDKILALKTPCKADYKDPLDPAWKKSLSDIQMQTLKQKREDMKSDVGDVFGYCAGCHAGGGLGAPKIPFHDMKQMNSLLERQAGELGNMQTRIWKRVKRHGDLRGSMPMNWGQLEPEEIKIIKDYLETFPNRDYVKPIDTGSRRNQIENVNLVE